MKVISESVLEERVTCKNCGRILEITPEDLRYDCTIVMGHVLSEGYYYNCIGCGGLNKLQCSDSVVRKLKG